MSERELCDRTGAELSAQLRAGEITAVELTDSSLARLEAVNDQLGAFLSVTTGGGARTRSRTRHVPRHRRAAVGRGRHPHRAQGRAHHQGHPHDVRVEDPGDLRAALRLHRLDAACRAPAACWWARPTATSSRWARPTRTRRTGSVHNPWNLDTVPGGSSGGSAAAVAAGAAVWASGHRHRRLGAPARVAHRRRGAQAHLRVDQPLRVGGVRLVAGHGGHVHAERARRRDPARRARRQGPS